MSENIGRMGEVLEVSSIIGPSVPPAPSDAVKVTESALAPSPEGWKRSRLASMSACVNDEPADSGVPSRKSVPCCGTFTTVMLI